MMPRENSKRDENSQPSPSTSGGVGVGMVGSAFVESKARRRPQHGEQSNTADPLSDSEESDIDIVERATTYSTSIDPSLRIADSLEFPNQLIWTFTRDDEFRDLLVFGVQNTEFQILVGNLRGLLRTYARDLSSSADTKLKTEVARIFREHSGRHSQQFAHNLLVHAHEGFSMKEPDFCLLASLITGSSAKHPFNSNNHCDSQAYTDLTNIDCQLKNLIEFLVAGPPFIALKDNLKKFLLPSFENEATGRNAAGTEAEHAFTTEGDNLTCVAWPYLPPGCSPARLISSPATCSYLRRGCIYLIVLGSVFLLLSLFLGVYYTVHPDYGYSMGDAFTLAGYVVSVGTLVTGALLTVHLRHCKCWEKTRSESISVLDRGS